MNGEIAQIRDIAIYTRHALKTKSKISYKPDKYENKIEFLFTENVKAKDVNAWYEHCIEKGLELVPNDYEFLTLKDDVKNDRGYFYSINHYINEEVDKTEDRELDYSDDKEWEKFKKETHYGEKCL